MPNRIQKYPYDDHMLNPPQSPFEKGDFIPLFDKEGVGGDFMSHLLLQNGLRQI